MMEYLEDVNVGVMSERLNALEREVAILQQQLGDAKREDRLSIICFSGEWDRLFAALTIAAGSLAMGMDVHLFFTFWALGALRGPGSLNGKKRSRLQSLFNRMLPAGPANAPLSRYNFGGLGKAMMKRVMADNGVEDIDSLYQEVKDLGAHFHLCDTTTELFGLQCHELNTGENVDHCGVATFLSHALKSSVILFI